MKMTTNKWKENEFLPLIIKRWDSARFATKSLRTFKAHVSSLTTHFNDLCLQGLQIHSDNSSNPQSTYDQAPSR